MSHSIVRRQPLSDTGVFPDALHPVLKRVYAARSLSSASDLDASLDKLHSPELLGGLAEATVLLEQAAREQQRILVVGDFDADGATSSALSLRALRMMGFASVDYLVPNRFDYGYGLTPEIVAVADSHKPDLILTVDNGISSHEGVKAAHERGIRVLITDHHLPGEHLPDADAIVNPNLPGDSFPSKNLAGVGVAFYLMLALRSRLREHRWFADQGISEPNLAGLLDLVALGTVADVVPLDHNNRILVEQGLRRIRAGRCCTGVLALLDITGRNHRRVVASDMGFAVAPRLNAAGRLDDMSLGIECLLTDDPDKARQIAVQLDTLNQDRKEIEADMQSRAMIVIEKLHLEKSRLPTGLCLFDNDWHQGVIGILASRIKERYHRPVIAFAPASDSGELKGSARSVPGLHIRDTLDAVATRHPGLITRFGGHAMAAGLSLPRDHFEVFRSGFDQEVRRHLSENDLQGIINSDGELDREDLTLEVAQLLRNAGPWGQGFPEPLFDGEFRLIQHRVVGGRHVKLTLRPLDGGSSIDGIAFNAEPPPDSCRRLRLAYRLDVNEYRGIQSPQLIIEHYDAL